MPTSKKVSKTRSTKTTRRVAAKKTATKKAVVQKASTKKTSKKAAKKTTSTSSKNAKSSATKKHTKGGQPLVCATGDRCFWTNDGMVLSNLAELADALGNMTTDIYNYHASKDRNDFADWVEYVLQDSACALELRTEKRPMGAKKVVIKYLKGYSI